MLLVEITSHTFYCFLSPSFPLEDGGGRQRSIGLQTMYGLPGGGGLGRALPEVSTEFSILEAFTS